MQQPAITESDRQPFAVGNGERTPNNGQAKNSMMSLLTVPGMTTSGKRKFSLPLMTKQQTPTEYLESRGGRGSTPSTFLETIVSTSSGKRLSQVGLAVSQQLLSATIGWKPLASHSAIVEQARCLCARYVRFKLRNSIGNQRKMAVVNQRLKSMSSGQLDSNISQVAAELKYLTGELERRHPKTFASVIDNLNVDSLPSVNSAQTVLQLVSQELFRNDITWARIAALYAIVGALAVDCVRVGHAEHVTGLVEALATFVDRDLAGWIAQQGGWDSLVYRFRTEDCWRKTLKYLLLSISIIFWAVLAYCLT